MCVKVFICNANIYTLCGCGKFGLLLFALRFATLPLICTHIPPGAQGKLMPIIVTSCERHLKSQATRLLVQQLARAKLKDNIKAPHCRAFLRGINWYPHKGPLLWAFPCRDVTTLSVVAAVTRARRFQRNHRVPDFPASPHNNLSVHKVCLTYSGLIRGLRPANERRLYKVTPSLICWAQT